jgi:hypothetical protein
MRRFGRGEAGLLELTCAELIHAFSINTVASRITARRHHRRGHYHRTWAGLEAKRGGFPRRTTRVPACVAL